MPKISVNRWKFNGVQPKTDLGFRFDPISMPVSSRFTGAIGFLARRMLHILGK
jgi:hypothetical protein